MIVGLRALEVEILDAEGKRVITHPRAYDDPVDLSEYDIAYTKEDE